MIGNSMSGWLVGGHGLRNPRVNYADHAVPRYQLGQRGFIELFRSGGPPGEDQIAHISSAVEHAHLNAFIHLQPELAHDSPRVDNRPGAVGKAFVPIRWPPQEVSWIAGTQGAHYQVVDTIGIFYHGYLGTGFGQ